MKKADHIIDKPAYKRLQDSQARIKARMPLPHELLAAAQPEAKEQLAIIIETTPAGRPLSELARRLSSRDLRLVFPLLAEADAKNKPDYLAKLFLLLRERACPSLYSYGWAVMQSCYPNRAVAKGLADLTSILAIRQKTDAGLLLSSPMISELADPAAKNLPELILKSLERLAISWPDFINHYAVELDLPLGSALLSRLFIRSKTDLPQISKEQFQQVLQNTVVADQASLLKKIINDQYLPDRVINDYFQVIYLVFGAPDSGHAVWTSLRKKEKAEFFQWILAATIGSHCQGNKTKSHFYFRYAGLVEAAEHWDENTLLIYFPGFCIADDKRQTQFAVYYESATSDPQRKPEYYAGKGINPASLTVPHRRVEDAVKRASTSGPVGLLLDDDAIQTSASFLDFCLAKKGAVSRSELKNLQPI